MRSCGRLFPPRDKTRQAAPVSEEWVQARLKDARWVATVLQRLQKLAAGRLLSRFFAASRARLREIAERLGVHYPANLGDCAAR